jgi:hypothetical protein
MAGLHLLRLTDRGIIVGLDATTRGGGQPLHPIDRLAGRLDWKGIGARARRRAEADHTWTRRHSAALA